MNDIGSISTLFGCLLDEFRNASFTLLSGLFTWPSVPHEDARQGRLQSARRNVLRGSSYSLLYVPPLIGSLTAASGTKLEWRAAGTLVGEACINRDQSAERPCWEVRR